MGLIAFSLMTLNVYAPITITPMFISVPEYSIDCTGFDEGVGRVSDIYYCNFNYSIIASKDFESGCNVVVFDETSGDSLYNSSFNTAFRKQEYVSDLSILERGMRIFYNYTANLIIPIQFNQDGRHTITFSFTNCKDRPEKATLKTIDYEILSTGGYYTYYSLKNQFDLLKLKLEKSERLNFLFAILSIILAIVSVLLAFKKTRAIIVDITDEALNKIRNFKKKNKK